MTKETWLYELIQQENPEGISKVESYMSGLGNRDMSKVEQQNVALLMWKCLPSKAEFAQALNSFLLDKKEIGGDIKFILPSYIQDAITHLVP
jgi:putative ATP-dependent endonuclease of OLD family